jgi:crotonobetainyl-CoA:carnitine CoA-transferase CaiB-like acyl-CoA transferase
MTLRPDGHPAGLRQIAFPGGDEGRPLSPPPRYGEHTRRVLQDRLGMADGEITDLVQGGVVDAAK